MSTTTRQPLVGTFTRAGSTGSGSYNDEARTVDVVMSSGAAVARRSWSEGAYTEILEISPSAVDLSRADGMSVINSHDPFSIENRVGTIVPGSARIAGGNLVGTIKLSRNTLGESLAQDLRDGHGFSVSVGYRVDQYTWDEGAADTVPTLTATRWLPMELSVVCIPADGAARTRSEERNYTMNDFTTAPSTVSPAVAAERQRGVEIRYIGTRAGMDSTAIEAAINGGTSIADFRAAAFDAMATRQEQAPSFPHSPAHGVGNHSVRADAITALTEVLGGKATRSGVAVAREYLAGNGIEVRSMGDRDVARAVMGGGGSIWAGGQRAMHATTDFAMLVGTAASNVLLERLTANPSSLKRFSRRRNAPDFRDVRFFRPGEAPALLKVNEHGEIKSGTMLEESNGFKIDTYARLFALTFAAGVNDGLGAFSDFLATFAESAIQLEGDLFAALLDGNGPRLDDGRPLFDPTHGNVADDGGAPSIETVNDGVIAMRTQRNLNNTGFAGTAPAAILVGPRLELIAKQLVSEIQATDAASVNPHKLTVEVEDRFGRDFAGWFLLADPARRPCFLHGGLESEGEAPKVETKEGWEVLGTEYRIVHHFGAGIHDHRAIYFNPGQ